MDAVVLDRIPFQIESRSLLPSLRMKQDGPQAEDVEALLREARAIARPKAIYGVARVESIHGDSVVIEGVTFSSRILRVNLEQAHRVFPFVATCGVEIEEWSRSVDGLLKRYFADTIKEAALGSAIEALGRHLEETFRPGPTGMMNPGSLPDWATSQQKNLFALFGDVVASIGVQLTGSCIMSPIKSVSGMLFPTETGFESCQLCPMKQCPKRRAPYDESLYEKKYRE